ncbi:Heavy metal-associated isoprenylated plant protein 2 [Cardamine amara subsp. amara]|uniref:Heavy metal-associated isoprenylated plant protein 2 n=1 Tax=Cardamine amara subsp. amara TaxID=228776 RepID=A0ABD1B1B2_CARAN
MTIKKIEIKVDINCGKCKSAIMSAVTELEGVNQVALDEEKSLLTVVGTMDPVCVAEQLRKIKQKPVLVSVGPPQKPDPKPEPKPECYLWYPNYYPPPCDMVTVSSYENGSGCTIL